ncbi:hypothetical protein [Curtobacterium sp. Leaf154]|uniref:hypothetical protein n=1 Tax=Curtobacterium sp. Leaf154 TaxID=1736277 RepID=UPI000701BE94|nr:hypothetical protein [Curtobacterium sp. Leaf154]KQR34789.1 hypothetical protein ASF75_03225 [Curtobacterium sp. Leaf154]
MTTPRTKQHELAENTRQQYQRRVEEIRNDRRFTPEAKQQAIAKLYRDTNHQLGQLRDERDATLNSRRTALEAEMFGLPKYASTSETLSYRDALDRASRAEDGTALAALYDTAAISNDTILAKAILAKAYGDGEVDVINRYLEDHSTLETKAQELWDIRYGDEAAGQTLQNTLNDFAFQADKPTEIRALSDSLIEQVAEASE